MHSDPGGTNPLVVTSLPSSCLEISSELPPDLACPSWCGAESFLSSAIPKTAETFPVTLHSLWWICLFPNYFAPKAAEWEQERHWVSMILWWNASQWWIWRADSSTNSVLNSAPHLHPNTSKSLRAGFCPWDIFRQNSHFGISLSSHPWWAQPGLF